MHMDIAESDASKAEYEHFKVTYGVWGSLSWTDSSDCEVEDLPPLEVDADLIRDTRERMHVSRAVFARRLRVSTRTLENWEQGRARPNAQAAALILMVRKFPDTLEKLSELGNQAA